MASSERDRERFEAMVDFDPDEKFMEDWIPLIATLAEDLKGALEIVEANGAPEDPATAWVHIRNAVGSVRKTTRELGEVVGNARLRAGRAYDQNR